VLRWLEAIWNGDLDAPAGGSVEQLIHPGYYNHETAADRPGGPDGSLTLGAYGHVIDKLEGAPRPDAEAAILAAREAGAAHELPIAANLPE
jgi:hypothetical protein